MAERYGDYELFQQIATGGMAEIHLARQSGFGGFNRLVIIKRMLPQLAVRPDFVTMFLDEARLTAALQHANIVRVHDLGEVKGSYFIAMELVDGPHLGSLFAHSLRARRPLPVDLCAWIVARAAEGLHYAHEVDDPATGLPLDLVHRDISPQNILISKSGEVKVTDFGVAKAANQQTKTRTGIIKGKVTYMSPEQCLGEQLDRRSDVFALGIVLYELVTRRRLFRDKSDLLVMQRITSEEVPAASTINPLVDAGLDRILRKALSRELVGRYQTALALAEDVDLWLAGRVDDRALAQWFEANCADLAPSSSVSAAVLNAPVAAVTAATPSLPSQDTVTTPSSPQPRLASPPLLPPFGLGARPEGTEVSVVAPEVDEQPLGSLSEGQADDDGDDVGLAGLSDDSARSRAIPRAALAGTLAALVLTAIVAFVVLGDGAAGLGGANATLAPAVGVGSVRVATLPSGVPIIVGDRVVGKSPVQVDVPVGTVSVQAQFADQPARLVDVNVEANAVAEVRLEGRVPLIVRSTPSRARLKVDGQGRGETPFEQGFLVEPGVPVTLRLDAPGMQMFEERVVPTAGEPLIREVVLTPLETTLTKRPKDKDPAPQQVGFGALSVRTEPWAIARWGDEKMGETPFAEKRVKAGRQTLSITNPQFGINEQITLTIPKDKTVVVILRFERQGSTSKLVQKTIR